HRMRAWTEYPRRRVRCQPWLTLGWCRHHEGFTIQSAIGRAYDGSGEPRTGVAARLGRLPAAARCRARSRVLRMCRDNPTTISRIGRELGITRQGAHKIVVSLRARRYVKVRTSPTNRSEKIVELTPRAHEYLATRRK